MSYRKISRICVLAIMAFTIPLTFTGSTRNPLGVTVEELGLCAQSPLCPKLCSPGPYPCGTATIDDIKVTCLGPAPAPVIGE